MSESISYDFDTLRSGAQAMGQFGQVLKQMGSQFKQVHQELQEHCSGDESGVGAAVVDATSETAEAGADVFSEGGRVLGEMGTRTETNAGRTQNSDETIANTMDSMRNGETPQEPPGRGVAGTGGGGPERPAGDRTGSVQDGAAAQIDPAVSGPDGQSSTTPSDEVTDCKDPIDVVSGMMFLTQSDVLLPGQLPLVLSRTFRSNYRKGSWFGPRWASTLDQRVETDADGVHFAAEDGTVLHYPVPEPGRQVLPVTGPRRPLAWNRDTDVITIADPRTGRTRSFPASAGRPVRPIGAVSDRNGHTVTFIRDEFGLPNEVRHSGGYRVGVDTTETRAGFRVSGLRLLDGTDNGAGTTLATFGYDPFGNLAEIFNSSGLPLVLEYDREDRITKWIDRNDTEYGYTYDDAGRVVATSGSDGMLSGTMAYHVEERITYSTDSLGCVTEYHWDGNDRVVKVVDPLGNETVSVWSSRGDLLSRTDPLGRTLSFAYDELGNLVNLTRPDGSTFAASFNRLCLPELVTDMDGASWRYSYDEAGNLLTATDPVGATAAYSYGESGRLASVTDAYGSVTHIGANSIGLPVSVTDPLGASTFLHRDAFGRVIEAVDAAGSTTRFGWTTDGNPAWRQGPDGAREEWDYDAEGNLVGYTDQVGARSTFGVTHFDLLSFRVSPDGARHEFAYDTELRMTTVTNPQGLQWHYRYDEAGRLVGETDFNGRALGYEYDQAGDLAARINGVGQRIEYVRDILGRLVERRADSESTHYEYLAGGALKAAENVQGTLRFTRDANGRVLTEAWGQAVLANEFDLLGRRVRRVTPTGVESAWSFDGAGRPTMLRGSGGSLDFEYDATGNEVVRRLGQHAAVTQAFDVHGRLTGQNVWASAQGAGPTAEQPEWVARASRSYAFRPDGHLAAVGEGGETRSYALDAVGRITAVTALGWREDYAYDAVGNLTLAAHSGRPEADAGGRRELAGTLLTRAGRVAYIYDGQGRVVRATSATLSGQKRIWAYEWNSLDQLTAVTTPDGTVWQYGYDPLGRRCEKRRIAGDGTAADRVCFVWDGTSLAEQITYEGGGDRRAKSWDYLPGTAEPVSQSDRRLGSADAEQDGIDQKFYAIVTDLIGSPTELIDDHGDIAWERRASVWGALRDGSSEHEAACPLRFPGQYFDSETGWHYNFFRYYDPETARYSSPDPLGLDAAPNNYAYCANPTAWIDPLGLISCADAKRVADAMQQRAQDGQTKRKAGPPPPEGKGYHGHLPQSVEEDIIKNPDAIYASTGTGDRVIFRKGDNIVIADGKGATKGHVVTSYGPAGPLGPTGVDAYPGSKPDDPGRPVTHEMLINGQVPNGKGGFIAPAVQLT